MKTTTKTAKRTAVRDSKGLAAAILEAAVTPVNYTRLCHEMPSRRPADIARIIVRLRAAGKVHTQTVPTLHPDVFDTAVWVARA